MSKIIKLKWAYIHDTSYFLRAEPHCRKIIPVISIFYILTLKDIEIIEINRALRLKYAMEYASSDVDHLASLDFGF